MNTNGSQESARIYQFPAGGRAALGVRRWEEFNSAPAPKFERVNEAVCSDSWYHEAAIREAAASPWMEVVSTSREGELRSIALGRELEVDWLMGGVHVEEALGLLAGSRARYLPFAGRPFGHPTRLGGGALEVEAQCRALALKGCAGVDILAYRATEAEPLDLVAACRRGFAGGGTIVAAGSVNSPERIAALRAAGADAFTIGTAAIEGSYAPGCGPVAAQLAAILADCGAAG